MKVGWYLVGDLSRKDWRTRMVPFLELFHEDIEISCKYDGRLIYFTVVDLRGHEESKGILFSQRLLSLHPGTHV